MSYVKDKDREIYEYRGTETAELPHGVKVEVEVFKLIGSRGGEVFPRSGKATRPTPNKLTFFESSYFYCPYIPSCASKGDNNAVGRKL